MQGTISIVKKVKTNSLTGQSLKSNQVVPRPRHFQKFHANSSTTFSTLLLTDKPTNQPTNQNKQKTFLAEIIGFIIKAYRSQFHDTQVPRDHVVQIKRPHQLYKSQYVLTTTKDSKVHTHIHVDLATEMFQKETSIACIFY